MADDVPMEGLEDEDWEAVEVEEADPALLTAELFLDSFGFELFEVENQSPHIDSAGDFASYMDVAERMARDYRDRAAWYDKVLVNIAKSGYFSSDRTIREYCGEIWQA